MLLVVAWDGASLAEVESLAAAGDLPNYSDLAGRGAVRLLESTWPPVTFPAWTTFMTAADPDRHGVTDFTIRSGYGVRFVNASYRRIPTTFKLMSEAGRRVGVYGVPATYPPEALRGIQVCGFDTPLGTGTGARGVHPPELFHALDKRYGGLANDGPSQARIDAGWHDRALTRMLGDVDLRTRIVVDLLQEQTFDCFMVHYGESDTVSHQFRQFCDPASPRYVDGGPKEALRSVYRALDGALGRLIEGAGPGASVMLVSDHGSMANGDRAVFWNRWLCDKGHLRFADSAGAALAMRASRSLALKLVPSAVQARLFSGFPRAARRLESGARFGGIDWTRTSVFSEELNYFPALWFNLRGREPQGVVEPDQRQALTERLRADLASFVDSETGEPVVRAVYPRAEVYDGPYAGRLPDLFLELAEPGGCAYVAGSSRGGREPAALRRLTAKEMTGARGTSMAGAHERYGLCLLAGPMVRPGRYPAGRLADAGATMLAMTGIAAVPAMNGRPWNDVVALDEAALATAPRSAAASECAPYTDAEEREVAERLRSLGYID